MTDDTNRGRRPENRRRLETSRVWMVAAVLFAAAAGLRAQDFDVLLLLDTTTSMFESSAPMLQDGEVAAIRETWPTVMDTIEEASDSTHYGLVLVNGDGGCSLAQDLVDRTTFLAGPFSTFDLTDGSTVAFSTAITDCVPLASFRPNHPRWLYLFTDTTDEDSTLAERDAAVAALVYGVRAYPMAVLSIDGNELDAMPNLADFLRRATCSPDVGSIPHVLATSADEYAQVPPPSPEADTCVPLLRDGFESGDTDAWSARQPSP